MTSQNPPPPGDELASNQRLRAQRMQWARLASELLAADSHRFPWLQAWRDAATGGPIRPRLSGTADRGVPDRSRKFCAPAQTVPTRSPEFQSLAVGGSLRASRARLAPACRELH